ncbi:MAG: hypothetical protein ACRDD7_02805 [Peptostreptococcaceae bacterium]
MNKKLTIFSIVLIITGIIGTIGFSISSVPYFIDTANQINEEINKESVIFNENINADTLNINVKNSTVVVKKHDSSNFLVTQTGSKENFKYEIKNMENELYITQNEGKIKADYKSIKTLKDLTDYLMQNVYSNSIVVYVPTNVNLKVNTNTGGLNIENDILLNNVAFNTSTGYISLPKQIKDLDKLDIKSNGSIRLSVLELLGIKDVNIKANYLDIYSNDEDIFIDNIENHIPQNINISNNKNYSGQMYIQADAAIANNLNIDAQNSYIDLDLPIKKYNTNFNLKTSDGIELYNLVNEGIISESQYTEYSDIRELDKIFNNNVEQSDKEYKVNIKAQFIELN